jgi:hypothetical protein
MLQNPSTGSFWLRSIIGGFLRSLRYRINIRENLSLKNQFRVLRNNTNKDYCLIIAGGPSFDARFRSYLERCRSKLDIFVINHYYKSHCSNCIIPDFYVISDPEQLQPSSVEMELNNNNLKEYIERTGAQLFTPYQSSWKLEYPDSLSFCDDECLYTSNIRPLKPRGYPSNTALKALAIALELPYRKIYVIGLDYDYLNKIGVDQECNIIYSSSHHYSTQNCGVDWSSDFSSLAHLCAFFSLEYALINKLESNKVFNLSEHSLIDTFTKLSPFDFEQSICKDQ